MLRDDSQELRGTHFPKSPIKRLGCIKDSIAYSKAPPEDGSGEGHSTAAGGALSLSLRNALRDEPTMARLA